jgi:conjugal transfer pilus assembly protein TraL
MHHQITIVRQLDAPPLFFMWEFDSVSLFLMCLLIWGVMGLPIVGVLMGLISVRGYGHIKQEGGAGLLVRLIYWYMPSTWFISKRYPSYIREYVGV